MQRCLKWNLLKKSKRSKVITESRERKADTLFWWPGVCCISHWRQWPQHWGPFCAYGKMHDSRHHREATGDQIRSSKTMMFCMPAPPWAGNEVTFACSTVFQNGTSASAPLLEMPMRQHTNTSKSTSTKMCTILQLPSCWERCNVRPIRDAHLKAYFILIIFKLIIPWKSAQQVILIVALWPFSPELWENSGATRVSECRVMRKGKTKTARIPKVLRSCWGRRPKRTTQTQRTSTMWLLFFSFCVDRTWREHSRHWTRTHKTAMILSLLDPYWQQVSKMNGNKDSLNEIPFSSQRTWMKSHNVQWLVGLEPNGHQSQRMLC